MNQGRLSRCGSAVYPLGGLEVWRGTDLGAVVALLFVIVALLPSSSEVCPIAGSIEFTETSGLETKGPHPPGTGPLYGTRVFGSRG